MTAILPDFIIIGAMKAGTTTLYEYLARHPAIGMSREKETDFFIETRNWPRGLAWYHAQFAPGRARYGEASPNYTKMQAFPGVPARVAALIPGCKLIFIARDPVDRAVSQYRHAVLSGEPVPPPAALPGSHALQHLIDTSAYAAQLAPWLAHFPREAFLFLQFESLVATPARVLSQVAAFLDIADNWPALATQGAANSADTLAHLPGWLFRLRQTRAAIWIKQALPRDGVTLLKRLVARRHGRSAPPLTAAIRAEIGARLADDSARFRALSGLQAPGGP